MTILCDTLRVGYLYLRQLLHKIHYANVEGYETYITL